MAHKIAKYFVAEELVPYGYSKYASILIDDRILWTIDKMRERFGKITVNNWLWGGAFSYSGWRPMTYSKGAKMSQHRWGRAVDMKFENVTPDEVREDIKMVGRRGVYQYITRCEAETPTWVHVDCCNVGGDPDEILFFNP